MRKQGEQTADVPPSGRLRWSFGAIELDETRLELRCAGTVVPLEPKPLELLMFLLRRCGEVVTREEILEALWPGRVVSDGVITNSIAKLRQALGADGERIITVPRYGYRFEGDVRLQQAPAPSEERADLGLKPGQLLSGHSEWRLLRPLSGDGRSEVWLAQHEATGEFRVTKFARTGEELGLLRREITINRVLAETLGEQMWFVRVLDWNLETEPFFLQTEYSPLGSLTAWCESQRHISDIPLDHRLNLIADCADAVAAAHSAGVLHKDLKPSNVIVFHNEGKLQARLCDFASSHLLRTDVLSNLDITRMGFTRTLVDVSSGGTPMYLPPEVIAGQVPTAQADIYALGVMLYQLVVGDLRAIFAADWESRIDDVLLRDDIAAAANADPSKRLVDATILAERLRQLDQRHIQAQALSQQKKKAAEVQQLLARVEARRGLWRLLAATLTFAAIAVGYLYVQARQARDEARQQAAAASAVSEFLTDDLLSAANPMTGRGEDLRVRDLLATSEKSINQRFARQPVLKARLKRVIGAAYGALGDFSHAEPLLLDAERTLATELGDADLETQRTRLALRDTYRITLRLNRIGPVARRIRDAEDKAGRPHPDIWYNAEGSLVFDECYAKAMALWLQDCSRGVRALIEPAERELGSESLVVNHLKMITGQLMVHAGHASAAEPFLNQAIQNMQMQLPENNPRLMEARIYWGAALTGQGKYDEAEKLLEGVILALSTTVGTQQSFYSIAEAMRARNLAAAGHLEEAALLMRGVLDRRISAFGVTGETTNMVLAPLVDMLTRQGKVEDAIVILRGLNGQVQQEGVQSLHIRYLLAQGLKITGKNEELSVLLNKNLIDARRLLVNGQWLRGAVEAEYGEWLATHGDQEGGVSLLNEGIKIIAASLGSDDSRTTEAQQKLNRILQKSSIKKS